MVKIEIHKNENGTSTLFVDDQPTFTGDQGECERKALELYEEISAELRDDLNNTNLT